MDGLKRLDEQRARALERLMAMKPDAGELHRLLLHLRWLRLSAEARHP